MDGYQFPQPWASTEPPEADEGRLGAVLTPAPGTHKLSSGSEKKTGLCRPLLVQWQAPDH